ncbi:hypothetical protein CI105_03635 [Candidatus Izimaplasma bacterium ZiA1]|uniref:permease prefix domain 1-containing protein n=1 Tax=Candidatus Izimoplasma sp. ZiA1 TaxID=2024899 RepID=UPI000BAA840E|nr:hypothetical protein CI105_03635 [Candidatus Izimaplasma bacterium ZiA1]
MMDLLNRYLYQIEKNLPRKEREEIINELKSSLLDQIDHLVEQGFNKDEAQLKVIKESGHPIDVAYSYRSDTPLIRRDLSPIMLTIMKIISIVLPIVLIISKTVSLVFSDTTYSTAGLFEEILLLIPSIINALLISFGSVFLAFIITSKYLTTELTSHLGDFNPKLLPKKPPKKLKVSLFESIITVIGGLIFIYIINIQSHVIAIYFDSSSVPLLNDNFQKILPFLNISILFNIVIHLFYLYNRRKNLIFITLELIQMIFSGVVIILIASLDIIDVSSLEIYDLGFINNMFIVGMYIGGIGTIIGGIIKYAKIMIQIPDLEELKTLSK